MLLNIIYAYECKIVNIYYSMDGKQIVSAGEDCAIKIWDASNFHLLYKLEEHNGYVTCICLHPNGK